MASFSPFRTIRRSPLLEIYASPGDAETIMEDLESRGIYAAALGGARARKAKMHALS